MHNSSCKLEWTNVKEDIYGNTSSAATNNLDLFPLRSNARGAGVSKSTVCASISIAAANYNMH